MVRMRSTVVARISAPIRSVTPPRCAHSEPAGAGTVRRVSWVLWLSVPVVATVLAALWSWLRSRPAPTPNTVESMQAHSEYLDALVQTARSKDRGPVAPVPAEAPSQPGD